MTEYYMISPLNLVVDTVLRIRSPSSNLLSVLKLTLINNSSLLDFYYTSCKNERAQVKHFFNPKHSTVQC